MPPLVTTAPDRAVFSCAWENFLIALSVAMICIVCTVGAAAFQPKPVTGKSDRIIVTKLQARVVKTEAIRINFAEMVKHPWPCPAIREAVAKYGRDMLRHFARAKGYSKKQIDEALMTCISEQKS
jgi:hypothetical protein